MTNAERAKQFMPYSALKGFEYAIQEQNVLKESRIYLGEDAAEELNHTLQELQIGDIIKVKYYYRQNYVTLKGALSKIVPDRHCIIVNENTISFRDILEIEEEI